MKGRISKGRMDREGGKGGKRRGKKRVGGGEGKSYKREKREEGTG